MADRRIVSPYNSMKILYREMLLCSEENIENKIPLPRSSKA
jgi:hypothetical protein